MRLKSFLKFVEIQTKLASVIPFILGALYTLYRFNSFKLENFFIMFVSLLAFDMATTAINNYMDYKKAHKKEGYNYEIHNAMVRDGINEATALKVIFSLLIIACTFGILLTFKTNIVVLLIGIISFLAGILYTFGPIPISRMPLGEIFSGVFMGFVILFLSIYIHIYDENIITLVYKSSILKIDINIVEVAIIFLISIPTIGGISNIMLANNICDVEEDAVNKRYTLPYYIGKENAHKLFKVLYYIGYIDIIVLVILKITPVVSLLVILTIIPVNKNIKIFKENPVKGETFVLAVKNFVLINVSHLFLIGGAVIYKYL